MRISVDADADIRSTSSTYSTFENLDCMKKRPHGSFGVSICYLFFYLFFFFLIDKMSFGEIIKCMFSFI